MNLKKFSYAYQRHGLLGFTNVLFGKLGIKKRLKTPIDKVILQLAKRIEELSKNIVQSGIYSETYLKINKKWSVHDTSSKLLGLYEKEVQDNISNIQNSNNKKKYFINIGAGEGFHIVSLLKKRFFEFGIAYEIDKSAKKLFISNMEKNKISNYKLFDKAELNFLNNEIYESKKLDDCLFLIDIEGDELKILNDHNLNKLKKSVLIIELHDFIIPSNELLIRLEKNYNILKFTTENRDLSKIKILDIFHDYEKWLMAQEGRPCKMEWIVCIPKK